MSTNDFKPFAVGSGANVTTQADWLALAALAQGFQSGKASSAQINKALRQSSTMAAMMGQFIANAGTDALDNGDVATMVTNLIAAMKWNLNLKSAAYKDTGNGVGQIPDMSYFASQLAVPGYQKLPGGLVMQWGTGAVPISGSVTVSYPISFSSGYVQFVSPIDSSSVNNYAVRVASSTVSTLTITSTNTQNITGFMYMALGKV